MSATIPDLYALFRLSQTERRSAEFDSLLKSRYIKLAGQCHPDKYPDDPQRTAAFQALSDAYDILSNPSLRAEYDSCF